MQLADVGVKCPRCGIRFNSKIPPTILDTGQRDSELRCIPADPADKFEQFVVCTCPSCGKADWALSFSPDDERGSIAHPNITPHLQYRTAAMDAERSGRDWYNVAMYYLYAAWCADDIMAFPQAREYRRLAVGSLRKSLQDESCPTRERVNVEYLIGEIMRRGGAFAECLQHFKEAIPKLSAPHAYMARKLMRLAEMNNSEPIPYDTTGV